VPRRHGSSGQPGAGRSATSSPCSLPRSGPVAAAWWHSATRLPRRASSWSACRRRGGSSGWAPSTTIVADVVVDCGLDGFHGGPLDDELRRRGIDHLVFCGFGAEATVDTTVRSANDRGYECLTITDAVAPFDTLVGARALASVTMSGGIFGAIAPSEALLTRPVARAAGGSLMRTHRRRRPVRVAVRRRHRPRSHGADLHRLADRLLWAGRLRRRHGATTSSSRGQGSSPPRRSWRAVRSAGWTVIHTREGQPTRSVRLPAQQAVAVEAHRRRHRRRRAVRAHPRAGRAGLGDRARGGTGGREIVIDKPGKGAFYATDLDLVLRRKRDHPPGLHRHHHRRVRAHDHAGGQRQGLRVPPAVGLHRARPTSATTRAALKMVTMQGGVFGAVASVVGPC